LLIVIIKKKKAAEKQKRLEAAAVQISLPIGGSFGERPPRITFDEKLSFDFFTHLIPPLPGIRR
jgi:hypothetical protein